MPLAQAAPGAASLAAMSSGSIVGNRGWAQGVKVSTMFRQMPRSNGLRNLPLASCMYLYRYQLACAWAVKSQAERDEGSGVHSIACIGPCLLVGGDVPPYGDALSEREHDDAQEDEEVEDEEDDDPADICKGVKADRMRCGRPGNRAGRRRLSPRMLPQSGAVCSRHPPRPPAMVMPRERVTRNTKK